MEFWLGFFCFKDREFQVWYKQKYFIFLMSLMALKNCLEIGLRQKIERTSGAPFIYHGYLCNS